MKPLDFEPQGDGNRFHYRILNREWQVFGKDLAHICMCQFEEEASMVCDALNDAAELSEQSAPLWYVRYIPKSGPMRGMRTTKWFSTKEEANIFIVEVGSNGDTFVSTGNHTGENHERR